MKHLYIVFHLRSGSSFEMIKDLAIKQRVFIITLFFYVNPSQ